ncbi:hypothetical protein ACFS7Z_03890 [Pontibacter toksunensis]|uniref:MalT-like TPR region domain-containing protein n=1 Tax=Pontibacter toksunensis TaxID=1332631 RepID=A0ABW6BNR6_9BACT
MDELRRLVSLIAERGVKASPLINQQDEDNLETKLFNLIKNEQVTSDVDAAEMLYGDKNVSANYRMLKSRMRKKLLNHLHFIEFSSSKFNLVSIESYKLQAMLLEAHALLVSDEYRIADKLLTQAIVLAKANQVTSCIVRALEKKLVIHSNIINKKAYLEAKEELQYYYKIEAQEKEAASLFQLAHIELSSSLSERNAYLYKIPAVLEQIHKLWLSSKSPVIYNLFHILSIHFLELKGDFLAVSDAVARAEKLLEQGHIQPNRYNYKYNAFIHIYALLRTRQYEEGLILAQDYLQLFEPQAVNWFAFMENYLLLAMHSGNYKLAGELLQRSLASDYVNTIQNTAKERWELYRRYLLLMHSIMPSLDVVNLPQGVLAELVMLPKDKAGYNLSLLVLDTIKSFLNRKVDDYESHAERVRKYITKYLRGEKAERPRLFLRLLLLVIKEDLHPVRARAKGQKLYEKLKQTLPPGDAFAEVEIIPYEHLWDLVLKVLEHRAA